MRLYLVTDIEISTHDLTRRSTRKRFEVGEAREHFNSRPHEEVDEASALLLVDHQYFNSRPHEEVDKQVADVFSSNFNFNSRPHEEVDTRCRYDDFTHKISTHDLTRRSTAITCRYV